MPPFIVRTVEGREAFLSYLKERIHGLVTVRDADRNAMTTFLSALAAAGDGPAVHIEDDILLAAGFKREVAEVLLGREDQVVQFFSMRRQDLTVGSRREPGRTFLMGQCFHLPAGASADLLRFSASWSRLLEHPTGLDTMVSDWLRATGQGYWLHVPSLVQHRQCVSMIDRRRSRARQSPTFVGEAA